MILCTCLCIWARVCERARFLRLSGPKLLCFGLFSCMGAGGFLVKPRQTPGGMIHFWGEFSLAFSARLGGAFSQSRARTGFFACFIRRRAHFFIVRELAEFGYMKRFCTSVHSSRLVVPFWFPIRSGRSWVGVGVWGWISCYVIGRGNTATAYLQAGMIRPVPGATADAVVDVQGGSGRRVPQEAKLGRTATPAPECGQAKLRVKFIGREYN